MRLTVPFALIGMFLVLYVLPLGVRPMLTPDEVRYAEIPREMLASGDWIVPRLNGIRYFEKPPLGYWLNAAAIRLFGENAFAVRLPSAAAAGLTAVLLFVWARRFAADATTPWLTVAVFLMSFEVLGVGVSSVLDGILSLFVTAAILLLYFAYEQPTSRPRLILLVLAGAACGLAFLTKGFLALAVPVAVIVPYAVWQHRLKICLRTAWIPLAVALAVVVPWAAAIHHREPDFWRYFFWVEHVQRFTSPHGGQHRAPFWFYVPVLLGGAMPWTPLAGAVIYGLRHTNRSQPMMRLAICWLVFPLLLFSASSGKLGTYILPCFPPLAFLIAVGVLRCLRDSDTTGFVIGARVLMVAAGLLLVALLASLFLVPGTGDKVSLWKWMIAASGLALCVVLCRSATIHARTNTRLALYCAAPVLLLFACHFVSAAAMVARKAPGEFLLAHGSGDVTLVVENDFVGAACWFYQRDDVFITSGLGEFRCGTSYADSRSRVLDVNQVDALIREPARTKPVVLVLRAKNYPEYEKRLPKPCREDKREGLVWAEYPPLANLLDSDQANSAGVP